MKVNPIGIQNYQQTTANRQQATKTDEQSRAQSTAVSIEPKNRVEASKVAVKGPSGTYAQYLTDNEKKALDMLFSRYAHGQGVGESECSDKSGAGIGQVIDVKV
jgi:hypothetical protein